MAKKTTTKRVRKARYRTRETAYPTKLGVAIREARERASLSQADLGVLLGESGRSTGQAKVSQWESGVRRITPSPAQAAILTEVLGWQRSKLEKALKEEGEARDAEILARRASGTAAHAQELSQAAADTKPAPERGVCRDLPKASVPAPEVAPAPALDDDKLLAVLVETVPRALPLRGVSSALLLDWLKGVLAVRDAVRAR